MHGLDKAIFTVFDLESYPNYFCLCVADYNEKGEPLGTYEVTSSEGERLTRDHLENIQLLLSGRGRDYGDEYVTPIPPCNSDCMAQGEFEHYLISFNGTQFDLQVLAKIKKDILRTGMTTTRFIFADVLDLIEYDAYNNKMSRKKQYNYEWNRKHFDMLTCCFLSKSLKQWEMFAGLEIRELPFKAGSTLTSEQMREVLAYCHYDTQATAHLFFKWGYTESIKGNCTLMAYRALYLKLPEKLQDRFDRTPSKLAVATVYHTLDPIPPRTNNPFNLFDMDKFEVPIPVKALIHTIENDTPEARKSTTYEYNGVDYGTGGAHFCRPGFHANVMNWDITAMYPSIVTNLKLLKTKEAQERFEYIRTERNRIKKIPEFAALNEGYKKVMVAFTGEFRGKSNYVASYDPAAGNAMCYFGQLFITEFLTALDMEQVTEVNTDGCMFYNNDVNNAAVEQIAKKLADKYNMFFEQEHYHYVYMQAVNDYFIYDESGNFVRGKGNCAADLSYKGHINAVTRLLIDNLIQDSLTLDWQRFNWLDFVYKYHKSAASKYAAIDGKPMDFKNYYMLWVKHPDAQEIQFSRDIINKKNGSIKARRGVWSQSLDDLSRYAACIDFEQYHRDLDDEFELWGREDLCTTRLPKGSHKKYKCIADLLPAT